MPLSHAILIVFAGLAAGAINAVVGSGTLITFPTLVAMGYPPLTSTMSNAVGLVAGSVSGTWGYRRELRGQWNRLLLQHRLIRWWHFFGSVGRWRPSSRRAH